MQSGSSRDDCEGTVGEKYMYAIKENIKNFVDFIQGQLLQIQKLKRCKGADVQNCQNLPIFRKRKLAF